jgi:hypothetical protein
MVTAAHAPRSALLITALASVLLTLVGTRLWPGKAGSASCSAGGLALGRGGQTGKILVFQHIYAINNYREVVQDQVGAADPACRPAECSRNPLRMRTGPCTVSMGSAGLFEQHSADLQAGAHRGNAALLLLRVAAQKTCSVSPAVRWVAQLSGMQALLSA